MWCQRVSVCGVLSSDSCGAIAHAETAATCDSDGLGGNTIPGTRLLLLRGSPQGTAMAQLSTPDTPLAPTQRYAWVHCQVVWCPDKPDLSTSTAPGPALVAPTTGKQAETWQRTQCKHGHRVRWLANMTS